ncbi:MAG: hypothetical protein Q9191_003420 [Dirinaria sp. TL-2023a]
MTSEGVLNTPNLQSRHSEEWENWMRWDGPNDAQNASRDLDEPSARRFSSGSRKRKNSSCSDHEPAVSPDQQESKDPPLKRSHNIVERRYRTNINDKIAALRDSVPSLRDAKDSRPRSIHSDSQPIQKLNKGTVLSTAVEYIRNLEKDNRRLELEISHLRARLRAAEQGNQEPDASKMAVNVGSAVTSPNESQTSACVSTGSSMWTNPAQGMIEVPEDMRRLRTATMQAQYAESSYMDPCSAESDDHSAENIGENSGRRAKFLGKVMIGSFAGLMIMQNFGDTETERKEHRKRSLSATSNHLRRSIISYKASLRGRHLAANHSHLLFALLKISVVLFILAFGIFLYAFCSKPKTRKQSHKPTSTPSLASPLELRRNAWLTAIQTVRVPRHNLFPEWGAVNLEALQYVLRQAIGWRGYAWLTGQSEDDEVARVRAWDIAIDAQLMGGDAEISGSRLVLTILASGTLPTTPGRLMLKAIHIRILLWKASRPGKGSLWSVVHKVAALLADQQWRLAKNLQKGGVVKTEQPPYEMDSLPEHLAALLQLGCYEVLTDPIIQRAHNLAWSRPTREDVHGTHDEMDLVVDDSTIRSPHDALCAWLSSTTLQKALFTSLGTTEDDSSEWNFGVALHTAPPASIAQARALAANAVFVEKNHQSALKMLLEDFVPKDATKKDLAAQIISGSTAFIDSSLPKAVCHDVGLVTHCALALEALKDLREERQDLNQALQAVTAGYSDAAELTWLSFATAYHVIRSIIPDETLHKRYRGEISRLSWRLLMWLEETESSETGLERSTETEIEALLSKNVYVNNDDPEQSPLPSDEPKADTATPVAARASNHTPTPHLTTKTSTYIAGSSEAPMPSEPSSHTVKPPDRRFSRSSIDSGYYSIGR